MCSNISLSSYTRACNVIVKPRDAKMYIIIIRIRKAIVRAFVASKSTLDTICFLVNKVRIGASERRRKQKMKTSMLLTTTRRIVIRFMILFIRGIGVKSND